MTEPAHRRAQLIQLFSEAKIDALLVTSLLNIRYLTGFTGSSAYLVVTPDRATIFTDPRYDLQVRREVDCAVVVSRKPAPALHTFLKRLKVPRLGIEAANMTVQSHAALSAGLKPDEKSKPVSKLVATSGLIETLRGIKSTSEIEAIRRSIQLNSAAFDAALKILKPGIAERDLAGEIDHQMRILGAEAPAFETIVASGANTALPHARPSAKPIQANELVLIDMGAMAGGYASDMTRMVFVGSPDRKTRQIYRNLLDSQLAAVDAVKHGVRADKVDASARAVLKARNLDKLFTHSTGHGLGLYIHESPRIARGEKSPLRAGMTVTIEPGVYISGWGGMRIEDTVLVTPGGCEVLTPTPKDLLVV